LVAGKERKGDERDITAMKEKQTLRERESVNVASTQMLMTLCGAAAMARRIIRGFGKSHKQPLRVPL
jgi:hypothetical protein